MKELNLAIIAVLSWTAATFFTDGVQQILDNYFLEKYHNKALFYFLFSVIFIIIIVLFSKNEA